MKAFTKWLTLAPFLVLAGCNATTATTSQGAGDSPSSKTDVAFITSSTDIIQFDKEEGKLAAKDSRNPAVLAEANKINNSAEYFAKQIYPAAARAGIKPPADLPTGLRVRLDHMHRQQGIDFDKDYVNDQIYSHQTNLYQLQDEAEHGTDPELKALAQRAVPVVQDDITRLRALQRRVPR